METGGCDATDGEAAEEVDVAAVAEEAEAEAENE